MIKRILEQGTAIRHIFGLDRKCTHLIPSCQDLSVLESIKTALDPLSDFTDILSGEQYVTVSSVRPLLHHLITEVCLQGEEDSQLTKTIKEAVNVYMGQKYDNPVASELLTIASFLDPRFEIDYVNEGSLERIKGRLVFEGLEFAEPCGQLVTSSESVVLTGNESLPAPSKKRN